MDCLAVLTGVLLASLLHIAHAGSVIGFAVTGGASHQAAFAQIGIELVQRGHDFAMLVSSGDTLSQASLARHPYGALKVYKFTGPSHIGTPDWLRKLDRDPQKVLLVPTGIFRCCKVYGLAGKFHGRCLTS